MSLPPGISDDADRNRVAALDLVQRLQAALRREDRADSVELIGRLVTMRAPMGGQWVQLAIIAANNGEVTLARRAIDLHVENPGGDRAGPYRKVGLLSLIGAWDEALGLLRSLPEDLPDPASYAYSRGTAALYVGEGTEAREYLEKAIRLHSQAGSPWLSLATLVDFACEPELADRIVAAEREMTNATTAERATYYYALGKAHADLGEHAAAFDAFFRAAALMKPQQAYSREKDRLTATEAVSGYDIERIAAIARQQAEPTARTIFVHGLPRSGTTLVEQVLTAHSEVSDGGEVDRLSLFAWEIEGLSCARLEAYAEQVGTTEAARLWNHWMDERFPAPGRVVDKSFTTSRYLGLAAALLPEAPLIWLRRNPLDCAWSCFRNRFAGGVPWSYDLADIAFHFRLEDELLARWQEILGERLLVVPYEPMVNEPEPWIRRILAHCGLLEEAGPFAPHRNRRTVTTSSVTQVRQPIDRRGIGVAEPYREFLAPFIDAYFD